MRYVQSLAAGLVFALTLVAGAVQTVPPPQSFLVYLGTYTAPGKSQGIYVSRLELASGRLSPPELAAESVSPSFLALHPNRDFLYAVNEIDTFEGKPGGSVSAFAIDRAGGRLEPLNRQGSGGGGPAHITIDPAGRHVLVANYGGGSVSVLPLEEDGRLKPASAVVQHTGSSVNPGRQKEPHAHSINVDAAGRFAYAADLGIDKVMIYRFDPGKGTLTPGEPPFAAVKPGSGPRHFAIHPSGGFAYVINEMTLTVTAFTRDAASGRLDEIQTLSTLPPGVAAQGSFSTAEVQVHPSGKFLYGANRGHDSIALFTIDAKSGRLTFVEAVPTQGRTPRNFGIDPSGSYLLAANQQSDSVVVFRIDPTSGRLTPTGSTIALASPVCVKFLRP